MLQPKVTISSKNAAERYRSLNECIAASEYYEQVCLDEYCPTEPWKKYKYLENMCLNCRCVKFKYSTANTTMVFLWKIPVDESIESALNKSTHVRDDLMKKVPLYHT